MVEKPQITKMEAVKQSMTKLGNDAKLKDLQDDIKTRFGFEMTIGHVKTNRNKLLKANKPEAKEPDMAEKKNGTVSKLEGVRQIMADLGNAATTEEIQAAMKTRFSVEMTSKQASTYKGLIRKGAKAKPAAKKPAAPTKEQSAPIPEPPTGNKTIDFQDILTLRTLLDRVGADHLKTLIDVMAK